MRGYGLVDSPRVTATPGQALDLKAAVAPDARAAAEVYPANYWLALARVPPGPEPPGEIIREVKGCMSCHQIGDKATREIPAGLGTFRTSLEAWDYRVRTGPSGQGMSNNYKALGAQRTMFADWTDRIAAGEFPKEAPPRPTGVERNLVVSLWDWGTGTSFTHTPGGSDRRDPTVNANGRIWGPDRSHDTLLWMDPIQNSAGEVKIPTRDVDMPRPAAMLAPSAYWGEEIVWEGVAQARSGGIDQKGRVWIASRIRAPENTPAFCRPASNNKFTQYFPIRSNSTRQVSFYDPRTEQWTLVDTCFTADHNDFGEPPENMLFFGQTDTIGWINTRILDETKNEEAAQGWCPGVLDTNRDGNITRGWTEPDQPIDPTRDHRIAFRCYAVSVSPDHSVWCTPGGEASNQILRLELGPNPPQTCKVELYRAPAGPGRELFGSRGTEVDGNGVAWVNFAAGDYVGSFDRRKCKVLNGPTATGDHCPEGWTFYEIPGPTFQGSTLDATLYYLQGVDRHDAAGLGTDVPITWEVNSDAFRALLPASRQWVTMRVPYPMGFYARTAHGRIDDPKAGWKGRGYWTSYMTYAVWHIEGGPGTMGGKGQRPKVVKFQFRPDPLAK